MSVFLKRLATGDEAATMVEYVPMVALVAAVLFAAVTLMGTRVLSLFTTTTSQFTGS